MGEHRLSVTELLLDGLMRPHRIVAVRAAVSGAWGEGFWSKPSAGPRRHGALERHAGRAVQLGITAIDNMRTSVFGVELAANR